MRWTCHETPPYCHLVNTVTSFWLKQKLSQLFSYLKNLFNVATLSNMARVLCPVGNQINSVPLYFCLLLLWLESKRKSSEMKFRLTKHLILASNTWCTGPGNPGKSWNFIVTFFRTGKPWKKATGPWKFWESFELK